MSVDKIKLYVEGIGEVYTSLDNNLEELSKELYEENHINYLGARINNEIFHLSKKVEEGMYIKYLNIESQDGYRIYTKTLTAIFILACKELYPDRETTIEYTIGSGLYSEFSNNEKIEFTDIELIKNKMTEIVNRNEKIERIKYDYDEGIRLLKEFNHNDKVDLYETLEREDIQVYKIGDYIDSYYGFLAPCTGYIDKFDLKYYYPGVLILHPSRISKGKVLEYQEQKQLAKEYANTNEWGNMMELGYVSNLNNKIINNKMDEVIMMAETVQERKFSKIADTLIEDPDIRIILIAGPSSSGKTSFSRRLITHLRVLGKKPIAISADDYFVDRELTPLDENGEPDFEALEAINLELFNRDLIALLQGESIELPKFNFKTGKSEKSGKIIRADKDHPIIVEGIHALNPKLATYIPEKNKFKIYISSLAQLNLDSHNRISTRDTRFLRRMVRDVQFRGNDVYRTFELWKNVTRGEDRNIFPYQEEADIMFDTFLVYELNVMRKFALPLLKEIDKTSEYYSEAKRLISFLKYFRPMENLDAIPPNSLLKEFIGGTSLDIN